MVRTMADGIQCQKIQVVQIGHNNAHYSYSLNGQNLVAEDRETDVGVQIFTNLKPSNQCLKAAQTATGVLSQVTRSFHYQDRYTFLKMHKMCAPTLSLLPQCGHPGSKVTYKCWKMYKGGLLEWYLG